ncbi:MAG TPA: ABC transporter ATP-binding protein [bacterium]|nr:ABC transporter ATP-binding protein [bacterium]
MPLPKLTLKSPAWLQGTPNRAALWAMVRPLLHRHRAALWVAVAMIPVTSVLAMLVPYLTKRAIDEAIVPAAQAHALAAYLPHLLMLTGSTVGVVVLAYLGDAVYVSLLQRTGQTLIADLRTSVYGRTLTLPRAYFDTHPIGTVLTRVTSDMEALSESLATGVLAMFADVLKTCAYLAMMFALNWRLTLVVLAIIPVLLVLIQFFQARIRRTFFVSRQALSEATGYLQECLAGMKTLQLFGAEQQALARFKEKNRRFVDAQNESNVYDALMFSLVEGITSLALALVLWYAAGQLLTGVLTLGVLVAFMEYIQRMFVPVREASQQVAMLQRAMAALDHVGELLREPQDPAEVPAGQATGTFPAPAGRAPAAEPQGESRPGVARMAFESLEFGRVRFRYRPDGPPILKGISFSLAKGQRLAIVGATGSGKSTIIKLLTRTYSGYEGSIRLNGRELRDIPADELGGLISVVHQGVFLYQGSVAFNIGLGREGVDRAAIEQAARYVSAHQFIERLEGGYDSPIAPGGANLSAGQCQLLSFARAVAAQTELIVLDEATSSIDSLTESLIQQAVGRLYQDKTVIAIAHRLSTIRQSDIILVMDKGQIVEAGNHGQLMALGGLYAALVGSMEGGTVDAEVAATRAAS